MLAMSEQNIVTNTVRKQSQNTITPNKVKLNNCSSFHFSKEAPLSPIIVVQQKMAKYLKGNDPIGDTPIIHFHDYWRKGIYCNLKST